MSISATRHPGVGLVRNTGLNLLGHGVPVLIALATMPVVVRGLGPGSFGLLVLAWTVVGYVGVFDLGFGRAVTKRVSEASWTGDYGRVRRLTDTAVGVQAAFGLLTGLLLWTAAGPLADLLLAGDGLAPVGRQMLRTLAVGVPAVLISNTYRGVLEGLHRFDLVNIARAPLSSAVYLVPAFGVLAGWSLHSIVIGLVVTRYAGALLYGAMYARIAPRAPGGAGRAELHDLIRFGGWIAASNAIIPLIVYMERFVVSGVRGPVELAFYAAPQELVTKLLLIPSAVATVLFPAFSGQSTRGDSGAVRHGLAQGIRLVALLLVVPAAALMFSAEPLLGSYLGEEYGRLSAGVLRILAFAVFLNGLAFVPFALVEGTGRPDLVAKYHLLELPVYGAALWWLVGSFGIHGAAWAWALRMMVNAPVFYVLATRQAGIALFAPLRGSAGRAVLAALLLLALAELVPVLLDSTPARLAAGALLLATFAAAAWTLLLEPADRATLLDLRRRVTTRARG